MFESNVLSIICFFFSGIFVGFGIGYWIRDKIQRNVEKQYRLKQ